ncbi:hypothetical protein J6TS2_07920 [Heyndrickxia sporothermodurans]|nr:hypothetical protein J6TS2_07920 [Heyndrickxia sporothermodurans]
MKQTVVLFMFSVIILLLAGCSGKNVQLEGKWKLTTDSETSGCFTRMSFLETGDPKPISVYERTDADDTYESFQVWFGVYVRQDDQLKIMFNEPKTDPFTMSISRNKNDLSVQYKWKSQLLTCSYSLEQ